MATRESVASLIEQCENALQFANDQLQEGRIQEHDNTVNYTEALQSLENAYNDLTKLTLSANSEQRVQLHRMRQQLQQLQNEMIINPH